MKFYGLPYEFRCDVMVFLVTLWLSPTNSIIDCICDLFPRDNLYAILAKQQYLYCQFYTFLILSLYISAGYSKCQYKIAVIQKVLPTTSLLLMYCSTGVKIHYTVSKPCRAVNCNRIKWIGHKMHHLDLWNW